MVKCPEEIYFCPLDKRRDDETKGIWFYVPEWIVRAYRLKDFGTNMGKVEFVIRKRKRPIFEYRGKQEGLSFYYKTNWEAKLNRERKKRNRKELGERK